MSGSNVPDHLPGRALKIGVTGARHLRPDQVERLRAQLDVVFGDILAVAERHAVPCDRIQLLSPLADGADRLVAKAATARGIELVCVLPFQQADYETTFLDSDSVGAFREALQRAEGRVLVLDGNASEHRAHSFEAMGRLIVRNCDLMIGIWDGHSDSGRGGSAATLRFAANFGGPIIWLHATDPDAPPRWIDRLYDFAQRKPAEPVRALLLAYLDRLFGPPIEEGPVHPSALHYIGHTMHRMRHRITQPYDPMKEYFAEEELPRSQIWTVHGRLMRWLSQGANAPWTKPHLPSHPVARAWFARYEPADARAGQYASRYRSSYVLILGLGLMAVVLAAAGVMLPSVSRLKLLVTALELVTLLMIGLLVCKDGSRRWQRKSIEYRLVAELCRKQQALCQFGWTLPGTMSWADKSVEKMHISGGEHKETGRWVSWMCSAWQRETILPYGIFDAVTVTAARHAALTDLIDDQISYHQTRHLQNHRAGKRLVRWGERLFFATIILVLLKCVLFLTSTEAFASPSAIDLLEITTGTLPAIAAALVGLRSYAEMEMLAEQSDQMLQAMLQARARIIEIDPTTPLASQSLGAELASVSTLMLEDLQGWAKLFRAKVVEA